MVDTAPRASTGRHCPTSALVPPNNNSKYWYIVGNLSAIGGSATVYGQRGRWSTLHRALRRVDIVKHLRAVHHSITASTVTSYATLVHTTAAPSCTGSEVDGRHCTARHDGSTLSNICARSAIPPQRALVHHRQPWRTRRRRHRARAARSMVDTASRASTGRHCPTSALVSPNDNGGYWYIVGNLGTHDGGATVHGRRHRWSTLYRAPRRVDIVRHLRSSRRMTTASTGTS
jgi:hypothetical protein